LGGGIGRCRAIEQDTALRKKVSELEEAMAAKDRENMTNRNMYDQMKKVSRNIKEVG